MGPTSFFPGFLKPVYDSYSFSKIPSTVHTLLGCGSGGLPKDCIQGGPYERVILLLIDGFGWKFLMKYVEKYPFLKRFLDQGIVSKISSQFPSTTAAHITTLCSNQNVGEHGIYEWFMYEPSVDRIVAPLLYTFAGDKAAQTIEVSLKPDQFFPASTLFQELKKHQIRSTVFHHESIADSIYSKWMFKGAERVGYRSWTEALTLVKHHLKAPGFFYLYYGDFDSEAHRHGIDSAEAVQALERGFHELEAVLMSAPEMLKSSTALLVAADHGMIDINLEATVNLNELMPSMESRLRKGADGRVLAPAGSCRDFFLHLEPGCIQEVETELQQLLGSKAIVYSIEQLIREGFFGPQDVSDRCLARMADLVILPTGSNSVWWYEKGRFEQKLHAMHGGLTPDELEAIFLFYQGLK